MANEPKKVCDNNCQTCAFNSHALCSIIKTKAIEERMVKIEEFLNIIAASMQPPTFSATIEDNKKEDKSGKL